MGIQLVYQESGRAKAVYTSTWGSYGAVDGDIIVALCAEDQLAPDTAANWTEIPGSNGHGFWAVYQSGNNYTIRTASGSSYVISRFVFRGGFVASSAANYVALTASRTVTWPSVDVADSAAILYSAYGYRYITTDPPGWTVLQNDGAYYSGYSALREPVPAPETPQGESNYAASPHIAAVIEFSLPDKYSTEGGSAADTATATATLAPTDAGSGTEAAAIALGTATDAGSGADAANLGLPVADAAAGADTAAIKNRTASYYWLGGEGVDAWVQLEAYDGTAWVDRSADVVAWGYTDTVDQPGPTATVTLAPDAAPLDVGQQVRLAAAVSQLGVTVPPPDAWVPLLEGRVVAWDDAPREAQLASRAEYLQSVWIEQERHIGGGTLEDRIDYLLSLAGVPDTVYAPTPSGMYLSAWDQSVQPVWDAIQALAALRGWVLRYRWDTNTQSWRLTLYDPRGKTEPDISIGGDHILGYRAITRALTDVRNAIEVQYGPTGDRRSVTAEDPDSIAKYGRRWTRINEASDSVIDSYSEAQALAQAVLTDLHEPIADAEVELDLAPFVRVHDLVELQPDGHYLTAPWQAGVVGVSHRVGGGRATTSVTLRGAGVPGYYRFWFRREAGRQGVQPPDANRYPVPPDVWSASPSLTLVQTVRGLLAAWDRITAYDYSHTEVQASPTNAFSTSNLVARVKASQIEITALADGTPLQQGQTYYVRIRHVSTDGRTSPWSPTQSATPGQVQAPDIEAGAVTADHVAAGAITADKIAARAITADKIASGAVTADKVAAGAVTADKLAAGAVTADKIAAGSVTTDKLAAGAVTADKIAARAITAQHLAALPTTDLDPSAPAITDGGLIWSKGLDVYQGGAHKLRVGDLSGLTWKGAPLPAGTYGLWAPDGLVAVADSRLVQTDASAQIEITSSSWGMVSGMSIAFTLDEPSRVLIAYSVDAEGVVDVSTPGSTYSQAGVDLEVRIEQAQGPAISGLAGDSQRQLYFDHRVDASQGFMHRVRSTLSWVGVYDLPAGAYSLQMMAMRLVLFSSGSGSGHAYLYARSLTAMVVR